MLEGADWNDTYDMARENGGSVCFYNFYANNFLILSDILKEIKKTGVYPGNELQLVSGCDPFDHDVTTDGRTVKGIRSGYIDQVKQQQGLLLAQTDWAVVRKADTATAVPTKIATWRAAIRTKATAMEKAITDASDMAAFKALFLVWDGDGNKSGILYDWPELEE